MKKKLIYDFHPSKDKPAKAMVAIHGWKGNRYSMVPLITSINISNDHITWTCTVNFSDCIDLKNHTSKHQDDSKLGEKGSKHINIEKFVIILGSLKHGK